ncbi:unnamed protein product [Lymnaea stagnalis]|uniref:RING-type domain-containing protein n=1 Tax=Lymnaea stagnalis TaxID=6523 RepID=A0AAV2HA34_LYMST
MVDTEINLKTVHEHWSLFLRCTICFGYMQDPHTLECGHTFCKRCLKRLAEITREDNPDVRIRRLSLSCPTCRHPFPAKPTLTDRNCTCIVLKHMVELWRRECKLLASSSIIALRSTCTQTDEDSDETKKTAAPQELCEEFSVRFRPTDQYFEAVMKRVSESNDDIETDANDIVLPKTTIISTLSAAAALRDNNNISSDSESSVASENDTGNTSSSASIPEMFGRMNLPRIAFTDCTPGRFLLMLVWCMYSVVIVGLAEAFLPYVILFTLFFFLVVLR